MFTKVCLIIGGGRGMGAATARQMYQKDYRLALMSPSDSCEVLAKELGGISLRGFAENKKHLNVSNHDLYLQKIPTMYHHTSLSLT